MTELLTRDIYDTIITYILQESQTFAELQEKARNLSLVCQQFADIIRQPYMHERLYNTLVSNEEKRYDIPGINLVKKLELGMDNLNDVPQYQIHDNGGRPFLVKHFELSKSKHRLYVHYHDEIDFTRNLHIKDWDEYIMSLYNFSNPLIIEAQEVWIGESPLNAMTRFSGGYGEKFYGNTILAHLHSGEYVHISRAIYSFKALSPIIEFVSSVGNNDVPYPWARDGKSNYYMLADNSVIPEFSGKLNDDIDIYDHLYGHQGCEKTALIPLDTIKTICQRYFGKCKGFSDKYLK